MLSGLAENLSADTDKQAEQLTPLVRKTTNHSISKSEKLSTGLLLYSICIVKIGLVSIYSAGHHDLHRSKTLISPSNVAQNANPGTVLETARPEDSKTPPTC